MKCVETYKTREIASEARRQLRESGIEARIMVDTIDSRHGALSTFDHVALMVRDEQWKAATALLSVSGNVRHAS